MESSINTAQQSESNLTGPNIEAQGIFILPAVLQLAATSNSDRRWLSRGSIDVAADASDDIGAVLGALGVQAPDTGLAALRMWGQTGERPATWIAAAEPVFLEAGLTRLCLHTLGAAELPMSDLRDVFDYLQQALGVDTSVAFARIGRYGYICDEKPMATARFPAAIANGQAPDAYMPAGDGAESHNRLLSEIQMSLHEHAINLRRERAGLRPINSLWIWGGGVAAERSKRSLPILVSDDPLLRGYWASCNGAVQPWSKDFSNLPDAAPAGFVAVAPDTRAAASRATVGSYLAQLRGLYDSAKLRRMTLIFRDRLTVRIRPRDRFRFWRGISKQLPRPSRQ